MGVGRASAKGHGLIRRTDWVAAALLAVVLASGASAREFRAADTQVEDYPTVQALKFMDRYVREHTGGQHQIRVFHTRQLGEESQTLEQTRIGAIDINRINTVAIGVIAPEINVLCLPFLFRSQEHLYKVLDGPIGEQMLAAMEQYGFIGLTFYDFGARSFYTNRPVRTLADLKGLRLRVQPSDLMYKMMDALGGTAVGIPYGQVLTALTARLVDGAENNWTSYVTMGHYKVARYYTVTEHIMPPEIVVMSKRVWLTLSPEEQAIMRAAAREFAKFMRQQWLEWENRSRKQAAEGGATIIADFDRDAFVAAVKPLHDAARADPKMGPLVERILAVP